MPEFDLIRHLQEVVDIPEAHGSVGCILGIGDDAAVVELPAGRQLVVCTDTLVEDVHFPAATDPHAVGYKSLAVNLSDLAAMGAEPAWFLLSLALPEHDPDWIDAFAGGMAELAHSTGIVLAGGDTTRGKLCITVTAAGHLPAGQAITRGGARPDDRIFVSGEPGRAAFALGQLQSGVELGGQDRNALDYPVPRLALGKALRGLATACIDLSDGLSADLGHILEQSGAGAVLELGDLPHPDSLSGLSETTRWNLQLTGGDDYELCFTAPPGLTGQIDRISKELDIPVTDIGAITQNPGLILKQPNGERYVTKGSGYQHFSQQAPDGDRP
jgi:thiamine-monophosphate kinase